MSSAQTGLDRYFTSVGNKKQNLTKPLLGQIRIGTRKYNKDDTFVDPKYPGFEPIVCLTASTKYGSLGPYVTRCVEERPEKGSLIENIWHSFKVLPVIPKTRQHVSRHDHTISWEWNETKYVISDPKADPIVCQNNHKTCSCRVDMVEWIKFHDALAHNPYPVRYPFGFDPEIRKSTLGLIPPELVDEYRRNPNFIIKLSDLLGIAEGRKQVYFRFYIPSVKLQPQYVTLQRKLLEKKNQLIIDVDGPRSESIEYYKETYKVPENWIENDTILWTPENAKTLLYDTKHSCGHTFGLAAVLLGKEELFLK